MTHLPEGRSLVQSFVFLVVGTVVQNPFARQLVKVTHRVLVSCELVSCTPESARQWFQRALSTYLGLLHVVFGRPWIHNDEVPLMDRRLLVSCPLVVKVVSPWLLENLKWILFSLTFSQTFLLPFLWHGFIGFGIRKDTGKTRLKSVAGIIPVLLL